MGDGRQEMDRLLSEMADFRTKADAVFGPLDARATAAAAVVWRLIRAASVIEHEFEVGVHRPLGWSWTGFRIMYNTYVLKKVEPFRLAMLLGTTAPSISSALTTLERGGFVKRSPSEVNGKMVLVSLTPKGRRAVEKVLPAHHAAEDQLLSRLSVKETTQLASLLDRLLTA